MNNTKFLKSMLILIFIGLIGYLAYTFINSKNSDDVNDKKLTEINLRLQWIKHSQFAGYLVAKEKGFYEDVGLKVNISEAGPDLKPQVTVASGTDDIGIGVPNQVIAARSNGVPLVTFAQIFQDSPNRYILKKQNSITDLTELKGKKVGLWLGGDEVEFISMLKSKGMTVKDVEIIPQEFSVVPFINGDYVVSQVTSYGELNTLKLEGFNETNLQILSPKNYNSAILGDLLFCKESYLNNNKNDVKAFLEASIKGWNYCIENPEEALQIVLKTNPELEEEQQKLVLQTTLDLVQTGDAEKYGIGYINKKDLVNAKRILLESQQIERDVDVKNVYDLSVWNTIDDSIKKKKKD